MGKYPVISISEKHYGTKVILFIDEYDVPLAKAFENGYYDQMIFLIRNLLEQALKTNDSLKFAVMTRCMRISKESIFTGLNNLKVLSVTDERYDEYFGFTDMEVREMLKYYETEGHTVIKSKTMRMRFPKTIGFIPAVMMLSGNLFKCLAILQPDMRLKNCLRAEKSRKRFIRN